METSAYRNQLMTFSFGVRRDGRARVLDDPAIDDPGTPLYVCNMKILWPFHTVLSSLCGENQSHVLNPPWTLSLQLIAQHWGSRATLFFVFFQFSTQYFFNTFNGSEATKSPPQQKTRQSQWSAAWNKLPEIHRHSSEPATDFQSAPLEELQGNGLLFFSPRRFTFRQTSERASRRAGGRENNEDWHGRGIVRVGVRDGEWEPWKRGRNWNRGASLEARAGT